MNGRYREILSGLMACPTAPFAEEAVIRYVRQWAADGPVEFAQDQSGNVLLRYRGDIEVPNSSARRGCHASASSEEACSGAKVRGVQADRGAGVAAGLRGHGTQQRLAALQPRAAVLPGKPHWVFAAHMDHPGLIATRRRGRELSAEFRGGVDVKYFAGARVRFFLADGASIAGAVRSARKTKSSPFLQCRVELDASVDVPAGCVGMWDLPAMRMAGGRIASRGCDDIAGCAAILCALEEIAAAGLPANVTALLTRAEETGFVGALAACRYESLPKDALVVAIETSKAHATAPLGCGVIVRVGDRTRTFDPSLTAHVSAVAQRLAASQPRAAVLRRQSQLGAAVPRVGCHASGSSAEACSGARVRGVQAGRGARVAAGLRGHGTQRRLAASQSGAAVLPKTEAAGAGFRFSRQLMSGGTCESTAYAMFGYTATGLCVALDNYHNQGRGDSIAAERIDANDFACLVQLLVAIARDNSSPANTDERLLNRLQGLLKERQQYL